MQTEGSAQFTIGNAFYRPSSKLSRDLGVLAAQVYRADQPQLRVLDGMTGCGVRSLRYLQEAGATFVWANDGDPDIHLILKGNLDCLRSSQYCITHLPTQHVLYQAAIDRAYFDLIDLDAFGNPLAFIPGCLAALRSGGLLYVTSTDGRSLSGQLPEQSLAQWGSFARSHPAIHEQALRVLIGAIGQQAAVMGYGIEPVFSLFSGQVWRVMVRLVAKSQWQQADYGFLGYCHGLGEFQQVDWRSLGRAAYHQDNKSYPMTISGPMWLGKLHDRATLTPMLALAQKLNWPESIAMITLMQAEAEMPPYFYTLGEVGRRAKIDIPKRDRLRDGLLSQGFEFSLTHIHPQGFKTNARFADCLAIVRSFNDRTVAVNRN
jgi:tRNA (guanine26-N2/guanine27-N2)-dimethyltransferase